VWYNLKLHKYLNNYLNNYFKLSEWSTLKWPRLVFENSGKFGITLNLKISFMTSVIHFGRIIGIPIRPAKECGHCKNSQSE